MYIPQPFPRLGECTLFGQARGSNIIITTHYSTILFTGNIHFSFRNFKSVYILMKGWYFHNRAYERADTRSFFWVGGHSVVRAGTRFSIHMYYDCHNYVFCIMESENLPSFLNEWGTVVEMSTNLRYCVTESWVMVLNRWENIWETADDALS